MNVCRTCKAPIIWALTPAGKRAPIDRDPVGDGTILLLSPTGLSTPLSVVLSGDTLEQARTGPIHLRRDHHVTCPDAEAWREKARSTEEHD